MITREDFESFVMVTDGIAAQGRQIVLQTGIAGGDYIKHVMEVDNAVGYVEWMEEKKKIDSDTAANLKVMLTSEDRDNFNIALLAIEQLKK
jgi:hypothetical protein